MSKGRTCNKECRPQCWEKTLSLELTHVAWRAALGRHQVFPLDELGQPEVRDLDVRIFGVGCVEQVLRLEGSAVCRMLQYGVTGGGWGGRAVAVQTRLSHPVEGLKLSPPFAVHRPRHSKQLTFRSLCTMPIAWQYCKARATLVTTLRVCSSSNLPLATTRSYSSPPVMSSMTCTILPVSIVCKRT
jgi:hypothetical protein